MESRIPFIKLTFVLLAEETVVEIRYKPDSWGRPGLARYLRRGDPCAKFTPHYLHLDPRVGKAQLSIVFTGLNEHV